MTHEKAIDLSRNLAGLGISHTLSVGIHENLSPSVQAHVDLPALRFIRGGIREAVDALDDLAKRHGLVLESSLLDHGIRFATPPADGAARVLR